jgi:hypothetical protein
MTSQIGIIDERGQFSVGPDALRIRPCKVDEYMCIAGCSRRKPSRCGIPQRLRLRPRHVLRGSCQCSPHRSHTDCFATVLCSKACVAGSPGVASLLYDVTPGARRRASATHLHGCRARCCCCSGARRLGTGRLVQHLWRDYPVLINRPPGKTEKTPSIVLVCTPREAA